LFAGFLVIRTFDLISAYSLYYTCRPSVQKNLEGTRPPPAVITQYQQGCNI